MPRKSKRVAELLRPVEPEGPETIKASEIIGTAEAKRDSIRRVLGNTLNKLAGSLTESSDLASNLAAFSEGIVAAQREAECWDLAREILSDRRDKPDATFADRLSYLGRLADRKIRGMVRSKEWSSRSTNQITNALRLAKVDGEAEAWSEIVKFAETFADTAGYTIVDDTEPAA